MAGHDLGEQVHEAGLLQLTHRDVHRHAQVAPSGQLLPPLELLARGPQRPRAERQDQVGLLGDRDELGGAHQGIAVAPTQQGFDAAQPAGAQIDQRLVVQDERAVDGGVSQRGLHPLAFHRTVAEVVVEDGNPAAAFCLGPVHGGVGIADHRVGVDE